MAAEHTGRDNDEASAAGQGGRTDADAQIAANDREAAGGSEPSLVTPGGPAESTGARTLTKAELRERTEKIQADNKRKKFEARARRAPVIGLVRMGVTVVGIAVVIGVGGWMLGTGSGHEDQVNANNDRISELRDGLSQVTNQAENIPEPEVLEQSIVEANNRGRGLLDIQNRMIDRAGDNSDKSLEQYGRLVEEARTFMTKGSTSGGDFLPHGRWYQAYEVRDVKGGRDGEKEWMPLPRSDWEWSMRPATDVSNDGEVPVLWEARFVGGERDGALLAWVKGMYDPGRGLFHGFELGHTTAGKERQGATTAELGAAGGEVPEDAKDITPPPDENQLINDAIKALDDARKHGGSGGSGSRDSGDNNDGGQE